MPSTVYIQDFNTWNSTQYKWKLNIFKKEAEERSTLYLYLY